MSQRVGLVLAGGAGRRMGRTKGDLLLGGSALAERAARVLWPFCASVLISVARGAANPAPGWDAVQDATDESRGPLAGLLAGFEASGSADLLVLACDYPSVESPLLRRLLSFARSEDDVVLVSDGAGRDHPLVGLWRRRAQPAVADALERGVLRVRSLLPDLDVRRVGPAELTGMDLAQALTNLNWPADLERFTGAG